MINSDFNMVQGNYNYSYMTQDKLLTLKYLVHFNTVD